MYILSHRLGRIGLQADEIYYFFTNEVDLVLNSKFLKISSFFHFWFSPKRISSHKTFLLLLWFSRTLVGKKTELSSTDIKLEVGTFVSSSVNLEGLILIANMGTLNLRINTSSLNQSYPCGCTTTTR